MRKVKYLVASLVLISVMANANPVTPETAATVAGNYYKQTYNMDAGNLTLAYTETSSDGQAVYYVFNVAPNNGFVIVSAEDAGYPIIGSSTTGHYVVPTTNNNVGFWMNLRKNEIISMRTNSVQPTTDVTNTWSNYINNTSRNSHQSMSSVAPLCSTTWDQPSPYNDLCPGPVLNRAITGCVATAMAQIMKYWAYPSVGIGSTCYYDEVIYGYTNNYGELCESYDTVKYMWSAMPDNVTSSNYAVAKLMYDCGVAVNMDYGPTESGAFVVSGPANALEAYYTYFGYNKWSLQGLLEVNYTMQQWTSLIENELNLGRPVQYQGTDPNQGGHSWVCDGYNSSGDLHMNWGWSGSDDGYYAPNALDAGGYTFTQAVGAIIGIMPPYKALGVAQVSSTGESLKVYPNPSNGAFTVSFENFTGSPQITIYNIIGQQVYSSKLTTAQTNIDLSNQSKGVYLYRVVNENGESISTGRLVIE